MKRNLTKLMAALALLVTLAIPMGVWGQEVTLDFTSNTWGLPEGSSNGATQSATFTDSETGYAITLAASTKYYYNTDDHYLLFGKANSTLTLPAFSFDVSSIEVVGRSGASGNVVQNIYVGNTAVSTATTGAQGTNTYSIDANYQAAGNVYVLTVTSAHNTQVTEINIYRAGGSQPTTYTVTYAAGDQGTGTMTDSNSPYIAGATVTLLTNSFTPNSGYQWDSWEVKDADDNTVTVNNGTFTMPASNVTVTAQWTQTGGSNTQTLTFDLSSNPGGWPTDNPTTLTNYTYTLNNVDYTFALKNVKCNTGYLMMTQIAVLGLPAIEGYKLTRVVAHNSGGCSTSTKVGISSSASQASYIAGGAAQTWSNTNSNYTYDLTSTEVNTMYYMYVTNKNAQVTSVTLTYEAAAAPSVATPTFSPEGGSYTSVQNVTISCTTPNTTIYYTTDGSDPDNTSTPYSSAITVGESMTIKAIAYDANDNASSIASATYTITIQAPLATMDEIFAAATAAGTTATSVNITFGNWVVSGVSSNGKNVFVTDGTKGFVIFNNGGNMGFTAGDILSGTASCKVQLYNGFAELTELNSSTSGLSVATGGTVTPANIAMADLAGVNTGALVHYNNLTCSFTNNKYYLSDGNTTIQVYTAIYDFGTTLVADHIYNITGVYQQFNTTKEVLPRSAADIEEVVGTVAIPTFSVAAGGYAEAQTVEIACETPDVTIYYTTDGSEPNDGSTQYTGPITVNATMTIKAIAYDENDFYSAVATAAYYILSNDNVYTVTEALAFSSYPQENVFVHGIVSTAPTQAPTNNGEMTYHISVDGTASDQLEVYKGRNLGNTAFTAQDDIQVGDIVTVFGNVVIYSNKKEFAAGNYLVEFERPTTPAVPSVTVTPNTISAPAAGANGSLEITYENIPDLISFDYYFCDATGVEILDSDPNYPTWIDAEIQDENDVYSVDYEIAANTGEARTAYFKVYTTDTPDNEEAFAIVTVNQAAYVPAPAGDEFVRITNLNQLTNGSLVVIASRYDATATNYRAMKNTIASGKASSEAFVSTISGSNQVLPAAIVDDVNDYYWVVNVNNGVYTFTNANGGVIGYGSSTNFIMNGNNTTWTISRETSGETLVSDYEGFVITNVNTNTRCIAYKNDANPPVFGPYSSQNINGDTYNFYLDFFVQVAPETYTLDITGYESTNNDPVDWHLITPPVNVDPATTGMIDEVYDLYYFDEGASDGMEWINYRNGHFDLVPGKGYLYAHDEDVTLTFTGTPYDGTPITLQKTENANWSGWNLVGNPYAVTAYIDDTEARDFYVMKADGSEIIESEINGIAPMQGIFVIAAEDGEQLTFTTTAPTTTGEKLVVNVSDTRHSVIDRAMVRFGEGRTLPKFMFNGDHTKLYIAQGNEEFAVVRSINENSTPVSFRAAVNGTYTLSVTAEEVEMEYLHLIDNLTGADVDLLATPSYTFEANTTDIAQRFTLVYATVDGISENTANGFAFFNGTNWTVSNEGDATLQVVDVMGRILSTQNVNGNATITLDQPTGVYMLRLVNGDNVKVQKVVVR